VTSVITEAYILVLAFFVARRWLTFKLSLLTILKTILATAVMGGVVYALLEPSYYWLGLENLNVLLLALIGALVYGAMLLLLKAVPEEFLARVRLDKIG